MARPIERSYLTTMHGVKQGLYGLTSKLNLIAANTAGLNVRFGWLMILAFLIQWTTFIALSPSSMVELRKAVLILSYIILLAALSCNLHLWSLRLAAVGVALNFAVILANGGLMPVSPESGLQAHSAGATASSSFGDFLPWSTCVLLPADQTQLWFLSDTIPVSWAHMVISPGDVIIGIALLVFMVEAMRDKGKTISINCYKH